MKRITNIFVVFIFFSVLPFSSFAEDARGVERVGEGTKDVVTSPGQIVEGVSDETKERGATGVVTGTAKGSVNAAGQAAGGTIDIGTGAVEAVLAPITD